MKSPFVLLCALSFACLPLLAAAEALWWEAPCTPPAEEVGYFEWTPLARQAYEAAIELRFRDCRLLCDRLRAEEPGNLMVHHVENYVDFLTIYIDERADEYAELKPNYGLRLAAIEAGDDSSPWKRFLLADLRLQWALVKFKFEEYTSAFFDINKAFKLLVENDALHPGFAPTKKDLAILHAAVGTVPEGFQWAVDWLTSLEGTYAQGKNELEQVVRYCQQHPDFIYAQEVYVLYTYLLLHLGNDRAAAWNVIRRSDLDPAAHPLASFVWANVAMRTGHNDEAIRILQQRPRGPQYHPFPYFEFMLGNALLHKLHPAADVHFKNYLRTFKGRNFIKEAHQKLAWHYLIHGPRHLVSYHMQRILVEGEKQADTDLSAWRAAKAADLPYVPLLKARLLFDGGYLQRALDLLLSLEPADLPTRRDYIEYLYRLGRVYQEMGLDKEALYYFRRTIERGRDEPWYFACRAALEMGHIYEKQDDVARARAHFELCLGIRPQEHRLGLYQHAKAGLNRLR